MNDESPLAPATHDQCYPGPGVWDFLLECLAPLVVLGATLARVPHSSYSILAETMSRAVRGA